MGIFHTALWSIIPFLELRASIPLGYFYYDLSLFLATFVSIISLIVLTAFLARILPWAVSILEKWIPFLDKILKRIMAKTKKRHSHKMEIIGDISLIIFVALPLPGSGAWTGILVAYIFGVSYKKSLLLISTGVFISGIIVALLTAFGDGIWHFFLSS